MTVHPKSREILEVPALEIRQGPSRRLYLFGVDGKLIDDFATISRVHRDDKSGVSGYQRAEVVAHIAEIRRYLESDNPMLPNSLVIAFDASVKFSPSSRRVRGAYSTPGTLAIPVNSAISDEDKPGWIVDGQQRTAAIREAEVDSFPVSVVGFIADGSEEQRAQFILVNATKPLPQSLIYELLPATSGSLPLRLQRRRLPSRIVERLNYDSASPLHGMIQTPTTPQGVIKDNSMLRALENSITDGALYRWRDPKTGDGDVDEMVVLLNAFWSAVQDVFPLAWGLPPRKSRLMHGAGIISLSFLMDTIADPLIESRIPGRVDFESELRFIENVCCWTGGAWDFGGGLTKRWNEIQNISGDVQLLTNYLQAQYRNQKRLGR